MMKYSVGISVKNVTWRAKFFIKKIIKNDMSTEVNIPTVLTTIENKKCIITLNKPKKLNSLDMNMIWKINEALTEWKDEITMIIIQGIGRAFCAGADVVNITKDGPKSSKYAKEFFRHEYELIGKIGTYPKPYVAIIDGITMGGGVGISVHGFARIATEQTILAMPETAIGLFPDVGLTRVLAVLPGNLGVYLGLTGESLKGADVARFGIATHFINSSQIPSFLEELIALEHPEKDLMYFLKIKTDDFHKTKPLLSDDDLKTIKTCFSGRTIEEIILNLEKDKSKFAIQTLQKLKFMAPTSLKFTLKAMQLAKNKNLKETLIMENRIVARICEAKISTDFYEGVKAKLILKEKKPKWNPPTLEQVTETMIQEVFKELPSNEELKFK